jgi:hypothetical protein
MFGEGRIIGVAEDLWKVLVAAATFVSSTAAEEPLIRGGKVGVLDETHLLVNGPI